MLEVITDRRLESLIRQSHRVFGNLSTVYDEAEPFFAQFLQRLDLARREHSDQMQVAVGIASGRHAASRQPGQPDMYGFFLKIDAKAGHFSGFHRDRRVFVFDGRDANVMQFERAVFHECLQRIAH